jgi:hypothetical protein
MSDWWEAFVISGYYGMGDPLARSSRIRKKGHSEGDAKAAFVPMKRIPLSEDREQRRGNACPPGRAWVRDGIVGFCSPSIFWIYHDLVVTRVL